MRGRRLSGNSVRRMLLISLDIKACPRCGLHIPEHTRAKWTRYVPNDPPARRRTLLVSWTVKEIPYGPKYCTANCTLITYLEEDESGPRTRHRWGFERRGLLFKAESSERFPQLIAKAKQPRIADQAMMRWGCVSGIFDSVSVPVTWTTKAD
jgi:hypothetical protein